MGSEKEIASEGAGPSIRTELPGPNARKVLEKDNKFISQSYTRTYPLVIKRARGVWVEDVDSNLFLDFTSGIAVTNTGHCHPKVVQAIHKQAEEFLHMSGTDFYYEAQSDLAAQLAEITPGPKEKRVFFGNSGAEAVEAALKLSRYHTKRARILAFLGAFHGRTMGALSLTASKTVHERGFAPLVPGVSHVPYGYCYRCAYHLEYPACDVSCIDWIREDLFQRSVPPEEVAAVFVEPIQGEGGYVIPPAGYHEKLYKLCHDFGILYVADEIQTGMGRTGKMFASDHFGVTPDILTVAKGIASGMPLGAMISLEEIMDWVPGSHASTFGGNPVACRAALATIEILQEGLIQNAAQMGEYFKTQLIEMQRRHRLIGDVRGLGLMLAIELVTDRDKRTRAIQERNDTVQGAFQKGLLLLGCGQNSIRFIPPLTVSRNEINTALAILDEVLSSVENGK